MQTVDDILTMYRQVLETHREAELLFLINSLATVPNNGLERLLAAIRERGTVNTSEYPRLDHPNSLDSDGTVRSGQHDHARRKLPSRPGPRSGTARADHRSSQSRRRRQVTGRHRPRPAGRKATRPAQPRREPVPVGTAPDRNHRARSWKAIRKAVYGCLGILGRPLLTDAIKAITDEFRKLL